MSGAYFTRMLSKRVAGIFNDGEHSWQHLGLVDAARSGARVIVNSTTAGDLGSGDPVNWKRLLALALVLPGLAFMIFGTCQCWP